MLSRYAPSKKLLEHTAAMIAGERTYVLLDDQRVAYQKILAAARQAGKGRKRTVILVNGGPGTGKSVIALHVMADLLKEERNVQHATGSRAFTNNLSSHPHCCSCMRIRRSEQCCGLLFAMASDQEHGRR